MQWQRHEKQIKFLGHGQSGLKELLHMLLPVNHRLPLTNLVYKLVFNQSFGNFPLQSMLRIKNNWKSWAVCCCFWAHGPFAYTTLLLATLICSHVEYRPAEMMWFNWFVVQYCTGLCCRCSVCGVLLSLCQMSECGVRLIRMPTCLCTSVKTFHLVILNPADPV